MNNKLRIVAALALLLVLSLSVYSVEITGQSFADLEREDEPAGAETGPAKATITTESGVKVVTGNPFQESDFVKPIEILDGEDIVYYLEILNLKLLGRA